LGSSPDILKEAEFRIFPGSEYENGRHASKYPKHSLLFPSLPKRVVANIGIDLLPPKSDSDSDAHDARLLCRNWNDSRFG
jgi:hypothetical protein